MNNNIKNTLRWGLLAVTGVSVMLSCTDTWDDHYDATSSTGYTGSTFQAIEEKASDFADIVKAVGYQRELASENIYTIWAPANGTYDKEELLELAATDKQQVIDRFIKNHMTRYAVSQNMSDQQITLLNQKLVTMTNAERDLFGDLPILEPNLACTNGVLHIIDGQNKYIPNINELIRDQYLASDQEGKKECSLYAFIEEKDSDILDESRSVSRGVDENGNKIWVDSVTTHTNLVLDAMSAEIYDEDSSFIAIIPSDAAWQKRYGLAASLLKFNPIEDRLRPGTVDSLTHYYAGSFAMRDLFFNRHANLHEEDSLVSTYYVSMRGTEWPNGVYYTKAPARGLPADKEVNNLISKMKANNPNNPVACSNGEGYLVNDYPMTPVEQFFYKRAFWARGHNIDQTTTTPEFTKGIGIISEKSATFDAPVYQKDEEGNLVLDEEGNPVQVDVVTRSYHFTDVTAKNTSTQVEVGFKLYNTLSGTYDLYLVTCPIWAKDGYTDADGTLVDKSKDERGYKFNVRIYERNEEGEYSTNKKYYTDLTPPEGSGEGKNFIITPDEYENYTDTLYLGKFTFKNAYYGRSDEGVVIKLSSTAKSSEVKDTYSREMLISDFILVPDLEATEAALEGEGTEEAGEEEEDN